MRCYDRARECRERPIPYITKNKLLSFPSNNIYCVRVLGIGLAKFATLLVVAILLAVSLTLAYVQSNKSSAPLTTPTSTIVVHQYGYVVRYPNDSKVFVATTEYTVTPPTPPKEFKGPLIIKSIPGLNITIILSSDRVRIGEKLWIKFILRRSTLNDSSKPNYIMLGFTVISSNNETVYGLGRLIKYGPPAVPPLYNSLTTTIANAGREDVYVDYWDTAKDAFRGKSIAPGIYTIALWIRINGKLIELGSIPVVIIS